MKPLLLERNCPPRFYRGGHRIRSFRGEPPADDPELREPEDWLASSTELFGGGGGISVLPDGRTLPEAIAADPNGWLGPEHLLRFGMAPGVLVKLLDAGERLPVHAHPDRAFAARHLSCPHGKTEAWLVLDAEPDATVWLGFSEHVAADRLRTLADTADPDLLPLLNQLPVQRGDAIVVPGGLPHAIGEGVFVVELQEPTDFSIMLETEAFGIEADAAYLGLDPDVALRGITRTPLEPDSLQALRTRWLDGTNKPKAGVRSTLAGVADPYFSAEVCRAADAPIELPAGFSVLIAVDGEGQLATGDGDTLDLASGQVCVTPHASGVLRLAGDLTVVRCRPPVDTQGQTHPPAGAAAHGSDNRKG